MQKHKMAFLQGGFGGLLMLQLERSRDLEAFATAHLRAGARVLICGAGVAEKSLVTEKIASIVAARGETVAAMHADPANPVFGPPGCVASAAWREDRWEMEALAGLATLDAGRFRLPLLLALGRLCEAEETGPLLLLAPGVTRGMAAAELLTGMVALTRATGVLVLAREGETPSFLADLQASGTPVFLVAVEPERAGGLGKQARALARTRRWDEYLCQAGALRVGLTDVVLAGAPPPTDAPPAWTGRQVVLLDATGNTLALGEVEKLRAGVVCLRTPLQKASAVRALVVRDARRLRGGVLGTSVVCSSGGWEPGRGSPGDMVPRMRRVAAGRRVAVGVASSTAVLVNGIFGDPMLHLRMRQHRRSFLFDLGEATRLQARIAHQVQDLFISHAHMDHIAGFMWFLRTRIGEAGSCRIFGPPRLAEHIAGLLSGIAWDRIGEDGPRFVVTELHGEILRSWHLQAGLKEPRDLGEAEAPGGLLLDEPRFKVRAATLDHGLDCLAFALEESLHLNFRKERLLESGFPPGPWINELKRALREGHPGTRICLPDGSQAPAGELGRHLVLTRPGEKLVYATDMADTKENREALVDLARGAHTLYCEASFLEQDQHQAHKTKHLTARACGEIAREAQVRRLIPFHLSRRYEQDPARIFSEVRAACGASVEVINVSPLAV